MKAPYVRSEYKSYAFTVRPRDGATVTHDGLLVSFLRKYCQYWYVVSEKTEEERHLHAGAFFKKAHTRCNMTIMLKRVFKDMEDDEKRVLAKGVRIMYNMDFIEEYLNKDDDTVVISDNMAEASYLEGYWPPTQEQDRAKAQMAVDKYYAKLECLWYEHQSPGVEVRYETVCAFLSRMMNKERLIRVIADDRKLKQTAMALSRYIRKDDRYVVELAPWENQK